MFGALRVTSGAGGRAGRLNNALITTRPGAEPCRPGCGARELSGDYRLATWAGAYLLDEIYYEHDN
jgi:hypothetical protein